MKWVNIENYENKYQINKQGEVRSWVGGKWKPLKALVNQHGYLSVRLSKGNKRVSKRLHRLLATAFIPNPENKPYINHKNGIKTDNILENLEWCTQSENLAHAYKMGLNYQGDRTAQSRPCIQFDFNGNKIASFKSIYEASIKTGTGRHCISKFLTQTRTKYYTNSGEERFTKPPTNAGGFLWKYKQTH